MGNGDPLTCFGVYLFDDGIVIEFRARLLERDVSLWGLCYLYDCNIDKPRYKSMRTIKYAIYGFVSWIGMGFSNSNNQSRLPFRLACVVWSLFALVMVNLYSSTLTAHITARKMSTPPTGSLQVVEEGVLSYIALNDSYSREFLLVSWKTGLPYCLMLYSFNHKYYFVWLTNWRE